MTMYKKFTIALLLLFAVILFYFANKFFQVKEYKLIASEKLDYLVNASDNFCKVGIIICFAMLIWVNFIVIKTTKFYWFWLPILFVITVAILIGYLAENIFIFTKQNGLWQGGFSVSYFVSIIIIIASAIFIGLDYIVLKKITKVI